MAKSPLIPLADRVIAIREQASKQTSAGLYLPTDQKEKSQIANVVAVGDEVKDIKVADKIVVREYSTTDVKVDGIEYIIVKAEDVLAKLA